MRPSSSFRVFRRKEAVLAALGGLLSQAFIVPLAGLSQAGAGSAFEVGSKVHSGDLADLTSEQVQVLLQQLDSAVSETVAQDPEVMAAIAEAVEETWPKIESELPSSPPVVEGEGTPSPSPSVDGIPTPAPIPSGEAPAAPAPAPSVEVPVAPAPAPSVEAPAAPAPQPQPSTIPSLAPLPQPSASPVAPVEKPAKPPVEKSKKKAGPRESWERIFGWDFELGVPSGLGIGINVTPVRPITVTVGVSTPLGVTVTAKAEVTLNILPIFVNSRWTPTVTVGYRYVHFTGLTDAAIDLASAGALADSDIAFQLKGTGLHMVTAMAGLEYVGRKGFHFGLRAGRVVQLGESIGQTDESGLVLSNFQSWSVLLLFGRRY